ncbi:Bone morphogenetic protein 10, partial [Halocaridina rubra]
APNPETEDTKEGNNPEGVTRIHSLYFNASLPRKERVLSATLRLYALITRDQFTYIGVERRVRILMHIQDGSPLSVCERDIYEVQNTWETFDVTIAIKYWLSHPSYPQSLQIHIESVFSTVGNGGDLDVATIPKTESEPLLLVYSTATPHLKEKRELKLMIAHEYQDIEEPHGSPVQRTRHTDASRTGRTRRSMAEEQEEESNRIYEGDADFIDDLPTYAFSSLEGRRRPTGRKRRAKNSCKRKPLKVDFKDIGWDKWIIAPPSYEAYQCSGKCFYPLASHLSPTKHAVVQNLVHSLHPDRASRACCVPTKLGPISLLYVENGTPTYEYGYNDMVVLECGCR